MSSPSLSFAPALFSEPCVVGKFYMHVMSNNLKRPRVNLPFNESHIYERTLTSKSQMSQNEHSSQQVASSFQMTSKWTGQLLQETEDTQPVWVRLELESIPAIACVGWTGEICSPLIPPWLIKRQCESFVLCTWGDKKKSRSVDNRWDLPSWYCSSDELWLKEIKKAHHF